MAIIKCPECGGDLSTSAPTCIHCGMQIALYRKMHQEDAIKQYNDAWEIHKEYLMQEQYDGFRKCEPKHLNSPAIPYYENAVDFGLGAAARMLARCYRHDEMYNEALQYYKIADDLGCHIACGDAWYVEYAEMYCEYEGCGIETDYKKAIELYNKALAAGCGEAAVRLGNIYCPMLYMPFMQADAYQAKANHPKPDLEKAKEYYRQAARLNSDIVYFDYRKSAIGALEWLYGLMVMRGNDHAYSLYSLHELKINENELIFGDWNKDEIDLYVTIKNDY